jgi:hypothetical protein
MTTEAHSRLLPWLAESLSFPTGRDMLLFFRHQGWGIRRIGHYLGVSDVIVSRWKRLLGIPPLRSGAHWQMKTKEERKRR